MESSRFAPRDTALSAVGRARDVMPHSESEATYDRREHEEATVERDVAETIRRARADPAAFGELYDAYFARVYGYVAARLGSRPQAEDVVADTFVRALGALPRFEYRGPGSFAAWLFRIAHNRVLMEYRLDRHPVALESDAQAALVDQSPEAAFEQAEEAEVIRRLIRTLSPRRQEVVTLRFFGGLRNREIAEVLGLDEHTVASHLCRALDELRTRYVDATK